MIFLLRWPLSNYCTLCSSAGPKRVTSFAYYVSVLARLFLCLFCLTPAYSSSRNVWWPEQIRLGKLYIMLEGRCCTMMNEVNHPDLVPVHGPCSEHMI